MSELNKEKYGYSREVDLSFEDAQQKTKDALATEGFGVLSEIRIDEKLKEKLGVDFRRYVIFGACNPGFAYKTLQHDINIGLLLPCNVVIYETDAKKSVVAAIDADSMLTLLGDAPEVKEVAAEVNVRLKRALGNI